MKIILKKSMVDAGKGFETQPMSDEELVKYLRGEEFRIIRRL